MERVFEVRVFGELIPFLACLATLLGDDRLSDDSAADVPGLQQGACPLP